MQSVKIFVIFILTSIVTSAAQQTVYFYKGVDLSALQSVEANKGIYKQNGEIKDALIILKNKSDSLTSFLTHIHPYYW